MPKIDVARIAAPTVPRGRLYRRKARAGLPLPGSEAGYMMHFKNAAARLHFIAAQRALPDDTPEAEVSILLEALVLKYCHPVSVFRGMHDAVRREARSTWRREEREQRALEDAGTA